MPTRNINLTEHLDHFRRNRQIALQGATATPWKLSAKLYAFSKNRIKNARRSSMRSNRQPDRASMKSIKARALSWKGKKQIHQFILDIETEVRTRRLRRTKGKKMEAIFAPKARSDIADILAWTEENFGSQTLKPLAQTDCRQRLSKSQRIPNLSAAAHDRKSPSIAEPIISFSAVNPREELGIGFGNPGTSFCIESPHPTLWRSKRVLHDSMDFFRRIFRTSIAVRHLADRFEGH